MKLKDLINILKTNDDKFEVDKLWPTNDYEFCFYGTMQQYKECPRSYADNEVLDIEIRDGKFFILVEDIV